MAHGAPLQDGQPATVVNGLFGELFGTVFDVATIGILCLAGASVMVGLGRLVPVYTMGDPSEFYQRPLISLEREENVDVIRVSKVVSVAHVLASIALEMAKVGRPPTLIFGWSFETPLAANLGFLLLGEGNIPWMVKALVRRAAPLPQRQPRIIIG